MVRDDLPAVHDERIFDPCRKTRFFFALCGVDHILIGYGICDMNDMIFESYILVYIIRLWFIGMMI